MSRIGKLPIKIPAGVDISVSDGVVAVKGKLGSLTQTLHNDIIVDVEGDEVIVKRRSNSRQARSLHGLVRALVNNMVVGVSTGFNKTLKIVGVGYRAASKGAGLELSLGHSHPINYALPEGITAKIEDKGTTIHLAGFDKGLLGHVAAKIRGFRGPEPYKGKGVRYVDEHVRRKAGKAAGSASS